MYEAVFVNPEPAEYPTNPATQEGKIVNPYLKHKAKVIRSIQIEVYDPFDHSIPDTSTKKLHTLQKAGNRWHKSTRHWVISNKLLFKKGEKLNALALSETERLLRQAEYINDARITVIPVKNTDSVDVEVRVQDKWAISIPSYITGLSGYLRFRDLNLFGTGQQFEQHIGFVKPGFMYFTGFYNVANIDNTYISSRLSYGTNPDGSQVGLSFDRPFFSPLAEWAGGLNLAHTQHFHYYRDTTDGFEKKMNLLNCNYDVWAGKTIKLSNRKNFFNQSLNVIVGGRYYGTRYFNRPGVALYLPYSFPNNTAFVGNVGFTLQQYYKNKFIYRFGVNEDVPEGLIVQFVYGGEKKEYVKNRYYMGGEIARAKHFNAGYLSASLSSGLFFNSAISNNFTLFYRMNYFSDLFRLRKWYLRQFFNYNLVYSENKPLAEKITLTPGDLYGFDGGTLIGNSKMILQSETVAYAPYNLVGFRFAPVLMAGYGMLGNTPYSVLCSKIYQAYSVGLLIRNENLLNGTFVASFGMYPYLPGGKSYAVKYNPVTSFTLRVRAFTISKPSFLAY